MARGSCVGSVGLVVHSHNTTTSGRTKRLVELPCLALRCSAAAETRAPIPRYRVRGDWLTLPATVELEHQLPSYGWQAACGEQVSNRDPASSLNRPGSQGGCHRDSSHFLALPALFSSILFGYRSMYLLNLPITVISCVVVTHRHRLAQPFCPGFDRLISHNFCTRSITTDPCFLVKYVHTYVGQ